MGIIIKNLNNRISFKHVRMGRPSVSLTQPPDIEEVEPEWVTESGDLGTFLFDDEINILFETHDPSNVIASFKLYGSLPKGVFLNTVGGSLYGYIEDDTSKTYEFEIAIVTNRGDEIKQSFSMSTLVTSTEIVWETEEDLGEYGAGAIVDVPITASVVEKAK